MELKEIKLEDLEAQSFIEERCQAISSEVGDSIAINALSGGVDSSVVSMLGHRALGDKLKTYFIDNGIMREGEPEYVVSIIEKCGVPVELVDAQDEQNRSGRETPGYH
jgi:GMP synthase (glutamine-hydrolysing)